MIDVCCIWVSTITNESIKNRSKRQSEKDVMLHGFRMALGSIFNGFYSQVRKQNGARLVLNSNNFGCHDDVKK